MPNGVIAKRDEDVLLSIYYVLLSVRCDGSDKIKTYFGYVVRVELPIGSRGRVVRLVCQVSTSLGCYPCHPCHILWSFCPWGIFTRNACCSKTYTNH